MFKKFLINKTLQIYRSNLLFNDLPKYINQFSRLSSNQNQPNVSLASYLKMKIKMKGPITVSEYIKECLGNPLHGYYMKKDVFGEKGDFVTSPEISQMFGELIGIWFLNEWFLLKKLYGDNLPKSVQLVELGPGRGTLMSDFLKIWNKNREAFSELNIFMVETSPFMRKAQLKNLCNLDIDPKLNQSYRSKYSDTINVTWLEDICELPRKESVHFFLANEFFDALPIQKFQKTPEGYKEILVDFNGKNDRLEFRLSKRDTIGSNIILKMHPTYHMHDHVEVSVESARNIEIISKRLQEYNGSMLAIDYGHNGECKDTLRAFKAHKLVDIFEEPGECDLTSDVDFSLLRQIASKSKLITYGPITQEEFLKQMQITYRFQNLLKICKNEQERTKLVSSFNMLMNPKKMGKRFKLLSLRKFDFKQNPPGFEEKNEKF